MATAAVVTALLLAVVLGRILLAVPPVRRLTVKNLGRLTSWIVARLDAPTAADRCRRALLLTGRRVRLNRDLARIRALLDRDETMSATRQLGNRIAYRWLVNAVRDIEASLLDLAADSDPLVRAMAVQSLEVRSAAVRDLGFRDLAFRDLAFRDLGLRDLDVREVAVRADGTHPRTTERPRTSRGTVEIMDAGGWPARTTGTRSGPLLAGPGVLG